MSKTVDKENTTPPSDWFISLTEKSKGKTTYFTIKELLINTAKRKDNPKAFVPGGVLLGRKSNSSALRNGQFESPIISRAHAQLVVSTTARVYLIDLGSMHGTSLGSNIDSNNAAQLAPAHEPVQLLHGDTLFLGKKVHSSGNDYDAVKLQVEYRHPHLGRPFQLNGQRDGLILFNPMNPTATLADTQPQFETNPMFAKMRAATQAQIRETTQPNATMSPAVDEVEKQEIEFIGTRSQISGLTKYSPIEIHSTGPQSPISVKSKSDSDSCLLDQENVDPRQSETRNNTYKVPLSVLYISEEDDTASLPRGSSESEDGELDDDSMTDYEDHEDDDDHDVEEGPEMMDLKGGSLPDVNGSRSPSPIMPTDVARLDSPDLPMWSPVITNAPESQTDFRTEMLASISEAAVSLGQESFPPKDMDLEAPSQPEPEYGAWYSYSSDEEEIRPDDSPTQMAHPPLTIEHASSPLYLFPAVRSDLDGHYSALGDIHNSDEDFPEQEADSSQNDQDSAEEYSHGEGEEDHDEDDFDEEEDFNEESSLKYDESDQESASDSQDSVKDAYYRNRYFSDEMSVASEEDAQSYDSDPENQEDDAEEDSEDDEIDEDNDADHDDDRVSARSDVALCNETFSEPEQEASDEEGMIVEPSMEVKSSNVAGSNEGVIEKNAEEHQTGTHRFERDDAAVPAEAETVGRTNARSRAKDNQPSQLEEAIDYAERVDENATIDPVNFTLDMKAEILSQYDATEQIDKEVDVAVQSLESDHQGNDKVEECLALSEQVGVRDMDVVRPAEYETTEEDSRHITEVPMVIDADIFLARASTPPLSDTSSDAPVTPESNKKRSLPAEFTIAQYGHEQDEGIALAPATTTPTGIDTHNRPTKKIKRIASTVGLLAVGAAIGSAGTVMGLMRLGA
ncbi:uncharacterized protein I303_107008 [Kwoniella dejecticola CBS 10117]|uniref:FHA domain-containing protein n=1 Tax=Kwoniella dejecticola CBS 10117 TaxID=1296121 RepID=A0AAJ8KV93_9TREE